jgi:hypothetical protein
MRNQVRANISDRAELRALPEAPSTLPQMSSGDDAPADLER